MGQRLGTPISGNLINCTGYPIPAPSIADKSDQEAASSTTAAVTPGRQQFHPSAAKAWASIVGSSGALSSSYGITSVNHSGTGSYTITFSTAFSSATAYAAMGSTEHNAANTILKFGSGVNKTTTTIAVFVVNLAGTLTDPDFLNVMFFGDQ